MLAISVVHSVDCAILRMILDDPDQAHDVLSDNGFRVSEAELLVISLPPGRRALLHTWTALLGAEVNIHYTYPLLIRPFGHAALALLPDNMDGAMRVLRDRQFQLISQADLRDHLEDHH